MSIQGPFLYPNVTSLPGQTSVNPKGLERGQPAAVPGEFGKLLDQAVRDPLKFSAHATQRIRERGIGMDPEMMGKMNEAIDKAAAKGIEETLVLSGDAAFIVSVPNRTVITALDRDSLAGNVFSNIDGAVII